MKLKVFFVWVGDHRIKIVAEKKSDAKRIALNIYGVPADAMLMRSLRVVEASVNDIKAN
jgi:hypothetical protein